MIKSIRKNTKLRIRRSFIAFTHDVLMVPIAWLGAYWLRYNLGNMPLNAVTHAVEVLPIVLGLQILAYRAFNLYRGLWRFASLPDLTRIIKSILIGTTASAVSLFLISRLDGVPRSVFPLYAILLLLLLGGSRFTYRWLKDHSKVLKRGTRVLIVGAGQAGDGIVRDLLRDTSMTYLPIAFVDDNPRKKRQEVHGVRIVGASNDIPTVVNEYKIDLIIIALPSANSASMRRVVKYCEQAEVPFRTLPSINHIASGHVSIDALREVSLEDLLGREPVRLDWQAIQNKVAGKTILVSGGGGSIGSELCRQLAKLQLKTLVIIDNSEYNLYQIERELQLTYPDLELKACLTDVFDITAVQDIVMRTMPQLMFHAAAYKHVPLLESQLRVAMRNNILGTHIMAQVAVACGVNEFTLISTDKAVNPCNIMGATKRAAELVCLYHQQQANTHFMMVRFGNVLGSAGSVVPLFRQQIEAGGPITVTHPEITRYFMTIPEACQLILQASAIGQGGEIFVLDMGESVKIHYLAEQMVKLAGLSLGKDINITYTGLRPGEKLYEELFYSGESLIATQHEKILRARAKQPDLQTMASCLDKISYACQQNDMALLTSLLQTMVPEYDAFDSSKTADLEQELV